MLTNLDEYYDILLTWSLLRSQLVMNRFTWRKQPKIYGKMQRGLLSTLGMYNLWSGQTLPIFTYCSEFNKTPRPDNLNLRLTGRPLNWVIELRPIFADFWKGWKFMLSLLNVQEKTYIEQTLIRLMKVFTSVSIMTCYTFVLDAWLKFSFCSN